MKRARLDPIGGWIGGGPESGRGTRSTVFDPATAEVLAEVETTSLDGVDRAVSNAKEASSKWGRATGAERARVLRRAASLLRERTEALATLEVRNTGKPIAEARSVDVPSAADVFEYFAGVAPTIHGEHVDLGGAFFYTRREPLGVCAGIGAWNYPLQIAAWKAAPALAAGNTMVFKPSELTPVTAVELARILTEAGLPDGVFNVVLGAEEVGRALSTHSDIAKVSVTGAIDTGRAVMRDASSSLKHLTMELGGKSPLIIFRDASLEQAVKAAMLANFFTQGEVCSNGTRVFVERSLAASFLAELAPRVARMKIGDPLDPTTDVGALISEGHRARVERFVERGRSEGASVIAGGGRPQLDGELERGWFFAPTVFSDCSDDMSIVREEIFGPVMSVLLFDGEDEVVARANTGEHGLAAGIFTSDLTRAHRMAARLEAGVCWINNYNITPVEMPFGGVKQSGLGRENGLAAIEHYTRLKSVYVELSEVQSPYR